MLDQKSARYDLGWNRKNQAALLLICAVAGVLLAASGRVGQVRLCDQLPLNHPQRVKAAAERIDPNTATVASLRRLPGVGETIAGRIVEFRRSHGGMSFRQPSDLAVVNRIGPAMVRKLEPYLEFPAGPPASTQTASPPR